MFTSTPLPWAAIIAFVALGAHVLGTGLLILINPRSGAVRWHAAFTFWIMAWLALQGWFALGNGGGALLLRVYGWVIHLMPAFFLAAALVETRRGGTRWALAVLALGIATAPFLNPVVGGPFAIGWQALTWGTGSLLHYRDRTSTTRRTLATGEIGLKLALLVVVPLAVTGVIILGGDFVLYAMPLITIVIQFMIFVGVVHHRFYDIEVRAARSGELAAAAAEQERLALLGEVSATLAHEIRNPLTGMKSLAQRLAGGNVDEPRRVRYAGVILGEVERLERIAENLLTIGRRAVVKEANVQATPIDPLLDDIVLLVEGRARRAQVTIERTGGGLVAAAPRDALAQSLLNLVINAVAHSPPGGQVRITAGRVADGIELRVTDSGPGVPPAERERIFEPFHTRGVGAGLGLAVVRRIARELGWDVGVRDAASDGTASHAAANALSGACFHLRVPAAS